MPDGRWPTFAAPRGTYGRFELLGRTLLPRTPLLGAARGAFGSSPIAVLAAEQVAFHFARKQAKDPASITEHDFQQLVRHFGTERAVDIIWWSSHCHYMTRVADAFQIPLERDNVFVRPKTKEEG